MARDGSKTRDKILTIAYGLFYKEGFVRVSMDDIAAAAGVTKRTLYYHFDSKDALVGDVLEHQHGLALARFQGWAKGAKRTPKGFVRAIFEQLETWAARPAWRGSGYTRMTMELADMPGHPVRVVAHRHKAAVEDWLTAELRTLGVKRARQAARQIKLLSEGAMALALIHRDTSYIRDAGRAAQSLINPN